MGEQTTGGTAIPKYRHTPSGDELHAIDLELLERTHIAALYAIWKAQGKHKKIVTLQPVDTSVSNVVVLQQMTRETG